MWWTDVSPLDVRLLSRGNWCGFLLSLKDPDGNHKLLGNAEELSRRNVATVMYRYVQMPFSEIQRKEAMYKKQSDLRPFPQIDSRRRWRYAMSILGIFATLLLAISYQPSSPKWSIKMIGNVQPWKGVNFNLMSATCLLTCTLLEDNPWKSQNIKPITPRRSCRHR